jgi:Terminase RNaseH-like domain
MDDIDQDDKLSSEVSYDKIKDWVYSVLLKIGNKNTKFRQIGNFIKTRCVIGDHIMSSAWGSMHYSAIKPDGTPLWPALWDIERLTADFLEYQSQNRADTWMAEMLNNPFENVSGRIKYNDICFLPEVIPKGNNYRSVFITVDPAISNNKRANKTAICVHAYNVAFDKWQLIEVISEKGLGPDETYEKLMSLTLKWGATKWFIESIAYQAALQQIYRRYLALTGLNVEVHPSPRKISNKNERILSWFSLLKTQEYALTQGMLNVANEIISFRAETKDNSDDVIDAASDAVVIKSQFEGQLDAEFGDPLHNLTKNYSPVASYVLNS